MDSSRRERRVAWASASTDRVAVAAKEARRSRVLSNSAFFACENSKYTVKTEIHAAKPVIARCSLVLSDNLRRRKAVYPPESE